MDIARHVVETYLKDIPNLMVRHHIDSFNDFIENRIPTFIKNSNPFKLTLEDKREIHIFIGGLKGTQLFFSSPETIPHACRLENKTYVLILKADIDVQYVYEDSTDTKSFKNVLIGEIPLLLKSNLCYLRGLTSEDSYEYGECKFELGGYFIINGQERVLLTQESLGANLFYAKKRIRPPSQDQVRTRSEKEVRSSLETATKENEFQYICGISTESADGTLKGRHLLIIPPENKKISDKLTISKEKDYANFFTNRLPTILLPGFDDEIPLISVFYALGFTTDKAIYDVTLAGIEERTIYDTLILELILSHEKYLAAELLKEEDQTQDMNLLLLRKQTRTRSNGAVFINLYSKSFTHIDQGKDTIPSLFSFFDCIISLSILIK
jgi:DNA-directed RNA polymerase beta subunit